MNSPPILTLTDAYAAAEASRHIDALDKENDSASNPCPDFAEQILDWRSRLSTDPLTVLQEVAPFVDNIWHVRPIAKRHGEPAKWSIQADATCPYIAAHIVRDPDTDTLSIVPTEAGLLRMPHHVGNARKSGLASFDDAVHAFLVEMMGDDCTVYAAPHSVTGCSYWTAKAPATDSPGHAMKAARVRAAAKRFCETDGATAQERDVMRELAALPSASLALLFDAFKGDS